MFLRCIIEGHNQNEILLVPNLLKNGFLRSFFTLVNSVFYCNICCFSLTEITLDILMPHLNQKQLKKLLNLRV